MDGPGDIIGWIGYTALFALTLSGEFSSVSTSSAIIILGLLIGMALFLMEKR